MAGVFLVQIGQDDDRMVFKVMAGGEADKFIVLGLEHLGGNGDLGNDLSGPVDLREQLQEPGDPGYIG